MSGKDNTSTVLQDLFQNRIGFGKAQYKMVSSLYMAGFVKCAMNLTMAIILPIVCHQWSVTLLQETLGLSLIYSGMTVGLLLQGFADRCGRRTIILMAAIIDIVALLGLFSWNWNLFVFFFFLAQVSCTLTVSITYIYMTEITTS
jgi:MFS family permease